LRYADDIILLAGSPEELLDLINRVNKASGTYDLQINLDKTKTMGLKGDMCNCFINGSRIEQEDKFPYL